MLTGYLYINFITIHTLLQYVTEVCACVRGNGGGVCGGYLYLIRIRTCNVTCSVDVVSRNKETFIRQTLLFSSHDGAHFIP